MKTMLIVDDSAYMQRVIGTFVKDLNVKVVGFAENGEEATKLYKELNPDIVTMDLAMEKVTGLESLKEIMLLDPNAVVIVISSTAGQKKVVEHALELGAKEFFTKPLDKSRFINYINEILAE